MPVSVCNTPATRPPCRLFLSLLALLCVPLFGCKFVGALLFFAQPPQITPAEHRLTTGRLAILIESGRPQDENAVFVNAFHEQLVKYLKERANLRATVIAQEEITKLRREHPDFRQWGVQEVGRALKADEVLYVFIDQLVLYESPGSPLLQPQVQMHLTVISPLKPSSDPRVWPPMEKRRGHELRVGRHHIEATSSSVLDSELRKLARTTAWWAALPFYDFDREEMPPREM